MPATTGPRGGADDAALAWAIPGVAAAAAFCAASVWVAGATVSAVGGHGFVLPPASRSTVARLVAGGPAAVWPGVAHPLAVWVVAGCLVAGATTVVALVVAMVLRRVGQSGHTDAARALAGPRDVAGMVGRAADLRARQLRPSLHADGRETRRLLSRSDVGLPLGVLGRGGTALRSSWEDVALAVFAPRAGKTTSLAVPGILEAPGPVVATSNKADLWAATAGIRSSDDRTVWTFDPQQITHGTQGWWWNPLAGLTTVEQAHRLAGHFIQEIRSDSHTDFWTSAAHDLLTSLVLAAASDDRSLSDVYEWLNDPVGTPEALLTTHGHPSVAAALAGRRNGAPETRDGIYETARTAAQCLRDASIMNWVTPPGRQMAGFDPDAFAVSTDALYLLSKDGAGAAAPLVAALTDRVLRSAVLAAERRGGRLDPPMVVMLDEAANICRIADLPDLYSHLGSRGVVPVTILQSYRQGVRVWGEAGMDALWSAATVKLIGPGIDDPKFAADVSRLVGDHDVPTRSVSRGNGSRSTSTSMRREPILPPERLRELPRGQALLLATGVRPAIVRLTPWYAGPRRDEIGAAVRTAIDRMTTDAGKAIE
jgi:type IV secretory pathway TraG/TraD family ATPase VirD4